MKQCATCHTEISTTPSTRRYCWECSALGREIAKRPRNTQPTQQIAGKLFRITKGNRPQTTSRKVKTIIEQHFARYDAAARKRGITFNLHIEQFAALWKKPCTYCGQEIQTIGIDRINSDLGYNTDNITPCCTTCNWAKRTMTDNDYIQHCRTVALHNEPEQTTDHLFDFW